MKNLWKVGSVVLVALLLVSPIAKAEGNGTESQIKKTIVIDSNLAIQKNNDGTIENNLQDKDLTINQQELILKEMNFTEQEINNMGSDLKESLSKSGGTKVNTTTKLNQYFNSLDGNKYLVTDENKNEIEYLRQRDAMQLSTVLNKEVKINSLSSMGSISDGIFSAKGFVSYQGKTSNSKEYEYRYHDSFRWSRSPQYAYNDKLAHAWQTHSTSVSSEASIRYDLNGAYQYLSVTPEGVYGSSAKVNFTSNFIGELSGYLVNVVRIPVSNQGTTGRFVAKYAHPWTILSPSISAGPVSIDFSTYIGDEWSWENTFTISGSPN